MNDIIFVNFFNPEVFIVFEEVVKQIASGSKDKYDERNDLFNLMKAWYGIINEEHNSGSKRMEHELYGNDCLNYEWFTEFNEENSFSCEVKQVLYYFEHRRKSIRVTTEYRYRFSCRQWLKGYTYDEASDYWKDKFLVSAEFLEEDLNVYLLGLIGSFQGNDHLLAIRDAFDVSFITLQVVVTSKT
jgi:hypothetical protein